MVSQCRFFAFFCSFSVETVERTRCDILVENFAEIGKIKTEFLEKSDFSQLVGKVLHNSNFLDAVRIFCDFLKLFNLVFHSPISEFYVS